MSSFGSILERLVNIEEKHSNNSEKNNNVVNANEMIGEDNPKCEIEFITFTCKWDKVPVSIIIDDKITPTSSMKEVLLKNVGDDPSINDEFNLDILYNCKLYFQLKVGNDFLILKKSQFLKYNIQKILSIKNLSKPVTIHIVRGFE